jgi:hypothetical protein
MEFTNYLAILGLLAGGAYLVLAVVAFNRSRSRHSQPQDEAPPVPRLVLSFEDNPLNEGEPTPERMKKLAANCATTCRRVFSEELNYTIESIDALERAITMGWGNAEEEVSHDVILSFGAYMGEVLVRRTRGRWVSGLTDDDPATVLFLGPGDEAVSVSPFLLAREKFTKMYGYDLSIAFTALEQKLRELKAV